MIRFAAIAMMCLPVALAGCDKDGEGSTITLDATDTKGNFTAGVDGKTGQLSIDAPGIKGKISLPKIHLDDSSFEMNGVKLYPGSTVRGMDIVAHGKNSGGDKQDSIRVSFASPADPATVRAWFADKLGKADFSVKADGNSLVGTDDEGRPFKLELIPTDDGKSRGIITARH
ncbi:MAG: hypothetical protein K2P79_07360 [Sphingomonas sp.]|nr:hypothetical protein [Sphingomonas sp.]